MQDSYFTGQPLRIGTTRQLLLDDTIVEDRWKLERVLQPPIKHPATPVLKCDKPWEGATIYGANVIWDEERSLYRMWYGSYSNRALHEGDPWLYYIAYAESDDGIHWEKPLMDICPRGEHKRTNIVYTGTHMQGSPDCPRHRIQIGHVFKDRTDPDPERRYKMIALQGRPNANTGFAHSGIELAVSPDGLHWGLAGEQAILDYHSDCENHVVRDEDNDRWLLYCRPTVYSSGRSGEGANRHHRRRVAVMVSPDLAEWSYPRTVFYPDELDCPDFDHTRAFRYGNGYIMLYGAMEGDTTGCNEVRLASSADGFRWEPYRTREPFIARGTAGSWDAGSVRPTCPPVPCGDDLLVYYSAATVGQHETGPLMTGIGVAVMQPDRFVEQRAGDETGYLLTREFLLEGSHLVVNALGRTVGSPPTLRVELLRHAPMGGHDGFTEAFEGFTLDDCDPIHGAGVNLTVKWQGREDLSELRSRGVYIRFELTNMGLYSFALEG